MKTSQLLKAALMGTNRVGSELGDAPHRNMQSLWGALKAHQDPAAALLQAAALEQVAWQAGVVPIAAEQPAPCPQELRPYVSPGAAMAAYDVMQNAYKPFIAEWITIAQRRGLLATPRLLPGLLAYGESNSNLREAIAEIVGFRGRWLAAQTEQGAWLSAGPPSDEALWQTGTLAQRRRWLEHHMQDAPSAAAQAIQQSWPGDSPDAREAFTALAAIYPHPAHEAWLQQRAVVDRRESIRGCAIRALMQIPESGFRQRSFQRAREVLGLTRKLFTANRLNCTPPSVFDAQWLQDGIREKPPAGKGPKAFWTLQILSAIPLRDWSELVGQPKPFAMKIDPDWSELVVNAWQASAMTHPDAASLAPLLARLTAKNDEALPMSSIRALVASLDDGERANILEPLKLSDAQRCELIIRCRPLLDSQQHPRLHRAATQWAFNDGYLTRPDAIALASCCDSAQIPNILSRMSKLDTLSGAAEEFARALEYRQNYLKHFNDAPILQPVISQEGDLSE